MSDYRDDLAAAHRRIAQLEDALAGRLGARPARRQPRGAGWGRALLGLTVFGILFCGGSVLVARHSMLSRDSGPLVNPPSARTSVGASWYTQPGVLPTAADVDGDGINDYVGLYWRAGHDDAPLYVAAVDGRTLTRKWVAGPFRSQWNSRRTHLIVAGNRVLVSDAGDRLHVLALATGDQLATVDVPDGVAEMCTLADGTARVALRSFSVAPGKRMRVFDRESDGLTPLPDSATCTGRYDVCPALHDGRPCFEHGALRSAPPAARTSSSLYVTRTLREGTIAIALGRDGDFERRAPPRAVAFMPGAPQPLWSEPLLVGKDEMHFGDVATELGRGKLVALYPTKNGPYRLSARYARTGALAWSSEVPGSAEGSYAAAFGLEGDRVLVVMNQAAHVFDLESGARLGDLNAI